MTYQEEKEKILKAYARIDEGQLGEDKFFGHFDLEKASHALDELVKTMVIGEDELEQDGWNTEAREQNRLRAEQRQVLEEGKK